MKKHLIILLAAALLLTSCAAISSQWYAERNMTRVELDMTKQTVIGIMGDQYQIVGSRLTPDGTEETIGYLDANNDIYLLTFLNRRLVEYHKEWQPQRHDHDRRNRHD